VVCKERLVNLALSLTSLPIRVTMKELSVDMACAFSYAPYEEVSKLGALR